MKHQPSVNPCCLMSRWSSCKSDLIGQKNNNLEPPGCHVLSLFSCKILIIYFLFCSTPISKIPVITKNHNSLADKTAPDSGDPSQSSFLFFSFLLLYLAVVTGEAGRHLQSSIYNQDCKLRSPTELKQDC